MSRNRILPVLIVALIGGVADATPPAGPASGPQQELRERQEVRLVLVPAVVTTRRGKVVSGLARDEFVLAENRVPQEIRYLDTEADQPVSLAFLLDVSGSMARTGKLDRARAAIRTILDALAPEDRFGLIAFADQQVRWITDLTTDRSRFLERLDVQRGYGPTALYDALAAAPGLVDVEARGRKAIVLITDGRDNASKMNTFDAVRLARSVSVPIYVLGFDPVSYAHLPVEDRVARTASMERFAEETGGRRFSVARPRELRAAIREVLRELRFQYVVGYYSTQRARDGGFRRIRLETTRKGLEVRTRSGYYATP